MEKPNQLQDVVTLAGLPYKYVWPSGNSQPCATNTSRFSLPPLLHRLVYFTPIIGVHLQLVEQVSRTIVLSDHALGDGE
jgi:hypothetical protein